MEKNEIYKIVSEILCNSLALDPGDIRPESRLVGELGMDSLDFLDIMFALENAFKTKMRNPDFDVLLRPGKNDEAAQGEYFTSEEIERLEPFVPAIAEAARKGDVLRNRFFTFITVDTLVELVHSKFAEEVCFPDDVAK